MVFTQAFSQKVEKERRNLVMQTYVVEQKEMKFLKEQDSLQQAFAQGQMKPEEIARAEEVVRYHSLGFDADPALIFLRL